MSTRIIIGDNRAVLPTLAPQSVHCCVTSPPFYGLRDYGTAQWEGGSAECEHTSTRAPNPDSKQATQPGSSRDSVGRSCRLCGARRVDAQIGLEATPAEYVAALVAVFREVWRVLRDDGSLWLNLGDSYAGGAGGRGDRDSAIARADGTAGKPSQKHDGRRIKRDDGGAKPKDLLGIPWMVAFALRADGWYLRSDIIWHKPNPMPESVTDRPTKSHEFIFLLTKSARYYYDADAIAEETAVPDGIGRVQASWGKKKAIGRAMGRAPSGNEATDAPYVGMATRNRRSVWTVASQPYSGAHFATFPPDLIEPCILAGAPRQACERCGAGWVRVVEKKGAAVKSPGSQYGNGAGRNDGGRSQLVGASSETVGWKASCECEGAIGSARGVVLDPFGGAGTTGLVADRLGRDAVLVELNPNYAGMADNRTTDDAPLFADVSVDQHEAPSSEAPPSLFEASE